MVHQRPTLLGIQRRQVFTGIGLEGHREQLRSVQAHAESLGLAFKPGSRVFSYARQLDLLIARAKGKSEIEVDNMELFKQNVLDCHQLSTIARFADAHITSQPAYPKLFELALEGNWRAYGTKPETPGRDAQFHLFVASTLRKSGLPVTINHLVDPDIVIALRGFEVGVAVKRVKTYKRLGKHLRKACEQSSRGERVGVAFVDVTIPANPHNRYLPVQNIMEAATATEMLVDVDLASVRSEFPACARGEKTGAIIFYAQIPYATPSGERGFWQRWTRVDLVDASNPIKVVGLDLTQRLDAVAYGG